MEPGGEFSDLRRGGLVGVRRIAYRLTVTFPDGDRIVVHVISELDEHGLIASQVDVEMRD